MQVTPKRLFAGLVGLCGLLGYVWVAAVRAAPRVRERKAASRRSPPR